MTETVERIPEDADCLPEALYSAFRHQTTIIRTRVAPWVPQWTPVLMAAFVALIAIDGDFVYDDVPSIVNNPTFQSSEV